MNREEFYQFIEKNPKRVNVLPEDVRDNKEYMLYALEKLPWSFMYFSDRLKDDEEIVKKAVEKDGNLIRYASINLRDNVEIATIALEASIYAFEHLSENLRDDFTIALQAISKNGLNFKYMSDRLKNYNDIIVAGIKNNPLVFNQLPDHIKNKPEFVLQLVKTDGIYLKMVDDSFKSNPIFVKEAVKNNWLAIQYVDHHIRGNSSIVEEALSQNLAAIGFLHIDQQNTDPLAVLLEAAIQGDYNKKLPMAIPEFNMLLNVKEDIQEEINQINESLEKKRNRIAINQDICLQEVNKNYLTMTETKAIQIDPLVARSLRSAFQDNTILQKIAFGNSIAITRAVASSGNYLPSIEMIKKGLKNKKAKDIYKERKDEWLAKLEFNQLNKLSGFTP